MKPDQEQKPEPDQAQEQRQEQKPEPDQSQGRERVRQYIERGF